MSNDNNVVTTTQVAPKKHLTSFNDLNKEQLVQAAAYFGTDDSGNVSNIKADLTENGVTWEMYVNAFLKEEEDETEPEDEVFEEDDEGVEEVAEIVTQEPTVRLSPQEKYLVKMTRDNLYFEFEDKKFTQEKPYAIMSAEQAQRILQTEEGFRQAYPAELQEFYDK